jgi:lipoate-protein ligase A
MLVLGAWSFFEMTWFHHNSGKCAAAYNMAFDEALLERLPYRCAPVLRFYGWTEPAATFGYFQKYAEVAVTTHLRPLIRRPTGGGIVPHDLDWTYSAVFPPGHEWHGLKAEESYRRIHDWLRLAFAELDVVTELAPSAKKALPGQCFVGHEKSDLLWHGRKIAGAAQRRNQLGLLIQGSIQPPLLSPDREKFQSAMPRVAENVFGIKWKEFSPDADFSRHVEKLAAEKYSQETYNQKR